VHIVLVRTGTVGNFFKERFTKWPPIIMSFRTGNRLGFNSKQSTIKQSINQTFYITACRKIFGDGVITFTSLANIIHNKMKHYENYTAFIIECGRCKAASLNFLAGRVIILGSLLFQAFDRKYKKKQQNSSKGGEEVTSDSQTRRQGSWRFPEGVDKYSLDASLSIVNTSLNWNVQLLSSCAYVEASTPTT